MQQWQLERIAQLVKLARYLITRADSRGLTHGEKHFIMQTALHVLAQADDDLRGNQYPTAQPSQSEPDMSDIPF